jgi:hypothetical protein
MLRNGSETSSPPDTLQPAKSTSGQLSMFCPTTCAATPSAISSPASAAGASRCASPDGPTTVPSGPAPARVSRFRARDSNAAMPMSDTSGPLFTASSPSADLQWSLANRLRQRMGASGSPLFELTWSDWDMPAGPPICRLRASARRTSGSDCGSWPTPCANEDNKSPEAHLAMKLRMGERDGTGANRTAITSLQVMAKTLASWPTPMAGTPAQKGYNEAGNNDSSRKTVELCSWPTPIDSDHRLSVKKRQGPELPEAAQLASWPTPQATNVEEGLEDWAVRRERVRATPRASGVHAGKTAGRDLQMNLGIAAQLASWATPQVSDQNGRRQPDGKRSIGLNSQAHGPISSGSPAATGGRGQLNPAFSRWLMGYPAAWDDCAPTATRSSHRSRRSS